MQRRQSYLWVKTDIFAVYVYYIMHMWSYVHISAQVVFAFCSLNPQKLLVDHIACSFSHILKVPNMLLQICIFGWINFQCSHHPPKFILQGWREHFQDAIYSWGNKAWFHADFLEESIHFGSESRAENRRETRLVGCRSPETWLQWSMLILGLKRWWLSPVGWRAEGLIWVNLITTEACLPHSNHS